MVSIDYSILLQRTKHITMSTTWVFVGLLCGRELAMATMTGKKSSKSYSSDWEDSSK